MSLATAELPTDPAELHAFALACQSELKAAELSVQYKALEIEKLKLQIAKLRRMQFGRSSERISRECQSASKRDPRSACKRDPFRGGEGTTFGQVEAGGVSRGRSRAAG